MSWSGTQTISQKVSLGAFENRLLYSGGRFFIEFNGSYLDFTTKGFSVVPEFSNQNVRYPSDYPANDYFSLPTDDFDHYLNYAYYYLYSRDEGRVVTVDIEMSNHYSNSSYMLEDYSAPADIIFNDRQINSAVYSSVCPYSYRIYYKIQQWGFDDYQDVFVKILKNNSVVSDTFFGFYIGHPLIPLDSPEVVNFAKEKLDEYVNQCLASQKIKTTCCLLVCCEPTKYELI